MTKMETFIHRVDGESGELGNTENFNYYCGAIILVKEGATTYKQMCEIIKVLKEKEIRVIAIIAAIGEKG